METNQHIHFMGITGSGCSATAAIAKAYGYTVSGCDMAPSDEYATELHAQNVSILSSHSPNHLETVSTLVVSPAIEKFDPDNAELQTAKERGIQVMTWQAFSGTVLQQDKFVIAIAGTHGKSTTTAMVASILEAAGLDPTVQLGAIVPSWEKNYRLGNSQYYVIEADEYAHNFYSYQPNLIAITTIEYDHPDFFPTPESFIEAFRTFVRQLKPQGVIVTTQAVIDQGLPSEHTIIADEQRTFNLHIPGDFNQANARLAFAVSQQLNVPEATATTALESFTGLSRRMSLAGSANGIEIFDDYGHHPTALLKTMQGVRKQYPDKRIYLVFQPHMYSRTKVLKDMFVTALQSAPVDQILLTDIYAAREHDDGTISSRDLVYATDRPNLRYTGSLDTTKDLLLEELQPGDIVVCMGAGSITSLSKNLVTALKAK